MTVIQIQADLWHRVYYSHKKNLQVHEIFQSIK